MCHLTKVCVCYLRCIYRLLTAIKLAAKVVNREINMAGLVDILGAAGNQNVQGEDQQKLDVFANKKFIQVAQQTFSPVSTSMHDAGRQRMVVTAVLVQGETRV